MTIRPWAFGVTSTAVTLKTYCIAIACCAGSSIIPAEILSYSALDITCTHLELKPFAIIKVSPSSSRNFAGRTILPFASMLWFDIPENTLAHLRLPFSCIFRSNLSQSGTF